MVASKRVFTQKALLIISLDSQSVDYCCLLSIDFFALIIFESADFLGGITASLQRMPAAPWWISPWSTYNEASQPHLSSCTRWWSYLWSCHACFPMRPDTFSPHHSPLWNVPKDLQRYNLICRPDHPTKTWLLSDGPHLYRSCKSNGIMATSKQQKAWRCSLPSILDICPVWHVSLDISSKARTYQTTMRLFPPDLFHVP